MSDWNGPGLYRIEAGSKRSARVALSGGNKADGTKVLIWNNDVNKNDVFAFLYAGIGKTGKHEYHIINNNSGTYMTYPSGAQEGKQLEGNVMSPSNERTRWSIIPLRNGSGKYWVTPVANSKVYLNINSNKTDNGTELWLYKDKDHPSCQFFLAQAFDVKDAPFNSPDVGRGK